MGEALGAVTSVVADDHARIARSVDTVEQVAGQPGAGQPHGGHVDAGRSGPEPAAQTRRAEAETAREALAQVVVGLALEQRLQLRARLGVRVLVDPPLDPLSEPWSPR